MHDVPEADRLRATERERLHALVAVDVDVANWLHADDFQLINPSGGIRAKAQYLGGVASGYRNDRVWEVDLRISLPGSFPHAMIDGQT